MTTALRWLPVVSAVLQLVGTALIVWGLKITTQYPEGGFTFIPEPGRPYPDAAIVQERPRAFAWGVWLLLAGLALAVVSAVRAIS